MTEVLPTELAPPAAPKLTEIIGRIAGVLASSNFPTGERARLRRQDPTQAPGLTFYRFALRHLPDDWERQQRTWMTLVTGLALMGDSAHRPDRPAGQALAQSGYAEARQERLLITEDATLHTLLLRAARFLAAKNAACNWVDFARLLLTPAHILPMPQASLAGKPSRPAPTAFWIAYTALFSTGVLAIARRLYPLLGHHHDRRPLFSRQLFGVLAHHNTY